MHWLHSVKLLTPHLHPLTLITNITPEHCVKIKFIHMHHVHAITNSIRRWMLQTMSGVSTKFADNNDDVVITS